MTSSVRTTMARLDSGVSPRDYRLFGDPFVNLLLSNATNFDIFIFIVHPCSHSDMSAFTPLVVNTFTVNSSRNRQARTAAAADYRILIAACPLAAQVCASSFLWSNKIQDLLFLVAKSSIQSRQLNRQQLKNSTNKSWRTPGFAL